MRDSGLEEGHGEDRTQSGHTLNSFSPCLSFLSLLLVSFSTPPPYFIMFLLFTPHLPFSSFHIFIRPFPLSISSLCVSERFGVGPHSVSHSSSINDQLEHGATQSLLTPPLLLSHTDTHTHHFNYFRLLWRQVSIFLSIPRPLQSLATSLPPSQWIYLPRLITRSSNQRCMASPVMSVREEEQDRKKDREGGCVDG